MTRRVAFYGKASFLVGWLLAAVLTTLWGRESWPLPFWPTVLIGAVIGYVMGATQNVIARRLVGKNEEGS